jgi:hypothetical protein
MFRLLLLAVTLSLSCTAADRVVYVKNNCPVKLTVGIAGTLAIGSELSLQLQAGQNTSILIPNGWAGRLWDNSMQDRYNTLFELFVNDFTGDYYDISIVDGYDIGMRVQPSATSCKPVECSFSMHECPGELILYDGGPCLSACSKYLSPKYCCTGAHSTPETCPPTPESLHFQELCPDAFTYAYSDEKGLQYCDEAVYYNVTFCI